MSRAAPASRQRAIGLLRIALLLVALYLVLVNALINSPLAETLVNRKPERFQLHWDRALMLWPGHITLWNARMHGQVRRNQWQIHTPRVSGTLAVWPLLRKELRFVRIAGTEPVIRVQRVEHDLAPPPFSEHGLRLVFDEVRVDSPLRFALDGIEVSGTASARARWRQQLRGGPFELEPSQLTLTDARIAHGDMVLIEAGTLRAQARIEEHRRREFPGLAMLDKVAADATLTGRAPGFELDVDEAFGVEPRLLPGSGDLEARVVLERGLLQPQSELRARLPLAADMASGPATRGDVLMAATVGQDIALRVDLPPIPDLVQRADALLSLTGTQLPLPPWDAQLHRIDGEVNLDSRFSSLAFVQPLLARLSGVTLEGRGSVTARVMLAQGQIAEGTDLRVREAHFDLTAYDHRFQGAAHAQARFERGADGSPQARAQVVLERFDLAAADAPDAPLGSGRDLTLDLTANGDLAQIRDRLDARLQFKDARLPDLTRFNRYLPSHGVGINAGSGTLGADMRMRVQDDSSGGRIALAARGASLRVGELLVRSDVAIDAHLEAGTLGDLRFRLPGTRVALRHASVLEPAGERIADWWATATITRGRVSLQRPLDIRADADVTMRDVSFLFSLFSQEKRFPRWIRRLVDAGQANVTGQVQFGGDHVIADHILASNDRFEVVARMRLSGAPPEGNLYARWGVLGLAVELGGGEREFHLVGAKKWFDAQPPYLKRE